MGRAACEGAGDPHHLETQAASPRAAVLPGTVQPASVIEPRGIMPRHKLTLCCVVMMEFLCITADCLSNMHALRAVPCS